MSQLFPSGGQIIGASASSSVLPMNLQGWFPLGWTVWSPWSPKDYGTKLLWPLICAPKEYMCMWYFCSLENLARIYIFILDYPCNIVWPCNTVQRWPLVSFHAKARGLNGHGHNSLWSWIPVTLVPSLVRPRAHQCLLLILDSGRMRVLWVRLLGFKQLKLMLPKFSRKGISGRCGVVHPLERKE